MPTLIQIKNRKTSIQKLKLKLMANAVEKLNLRKKSNNFFPTWTNCSMFAGIEGCKRKKKKGKKD